MSTIIFWQNTPSIHQAPLIREIAKATDKDVIVVAETGLDSSRKTQGWSVPSYGNAKLIVSPNEEERNQLIKITSNPTDCHVFSGFHAYPKTYQTFKKISKGPSQIGFYVEPGAIHDGMKVFLRKLRYRVHAYQWRKRIDFILTTGKLGVDWYKDCGFIEEKIYTFGYFVDSVESQIDTSATSRQFKIIFVGELSMRKGVDLLVNSLRGIDDLDWVLDIVGSGPLNDELNLLIDKLELRSKVRLLGNVDNKDVKILISAADLLVLPSRFDGWGAVINEALIAGTPVIVSEKSGASDLVAHESLGQVLKQIDVKHLADSLNIALKKGKLTLGDRGRNKDWASNSISPKVAASYFLEIVQRSSVSGVRPVAPWHSR